MTSLAHTASTPRFRQPRGHLRAYLAGVGATTALTSGALVVFLSLATFVAFKGLPFGGPGGGGGAAYLGANAGAPAAAGAALRAAASAVAKDPVAGSHGAGATGRPRDHGAVSGSTARGSHWGGTRSGGGSSGGGPTGPGGTSPSGPPSTPSVPTPPGGIAPPPFRRRPPRRPCSPLRLSPRRPWCPSYPPRP